jgi:hypothetical protein
MPQRNRLSASPTWNLPHFAGQGPALTGPVTMQDLAGLNRSITTVVGKATPNPCNIHTTKFFFTNDEDEIL